MTDRSSPFESLDYIYMPSRDVPADVAYFTDVLGASLNFAIDGMGTRVAMVQLAGGPPKILLADHVAGEAPILVFRVTALSTTIKSLEDRGWQRGRMLELPQGPCCSFVVPGGQRIAIFELTRPEVEAHFVGRRDF